MNTTASTKKRYGLTVKILIAMIAGIIVGLILHLLSNASVPYTEEIKSALDAVGKIFIRSMKMIVVPVVFVSLVCGTSSLGDSRRFGRLAIKTLLLYLLTTALAISIALVIASLVKVGSGSTLQVVANHFNGQQAPSLKQTLINIVPSNPFAAMASGNMLQVIVFSILFGMAIALSGKAGEKVADFFKKLNEVIMQLITMLVQFAPYGVFCLISLLFARLGAALVYELLSYFLTVLVVLLIHLLITYPVLLQLLARLNPIQFLRKMISAMVFAFSTSSSNVSIPVVLETVEHKLGVRNAIASFIVPLGATINMDGTAIMQGVATVFIANAYHIPIGFSGFLTVIVTATLASIGTAGVPGVGLITLIMVLQQVGLPVEGIALIIGVDRLLDMVRTAVNITGDSAIACIVAKSEKALNMDVYNDPYAHIEGKADLDYN